MFSDSPDCYARKIEDKSLVKHFGGNIHMNQTTIESGSADAPH